MPGTSLKDEIFSLKEKRDAIILVHNYQLPEVQDIADLCGDSLELSRAAATMDGEVIVFCGVDFMAKPRPFSRQGRLFCSPHLIPAARWPR